MTISPASPILASGNMMILSQASDSNAAPLIASFSIKATVSTFFASSTMSISSNVTEVNPPGL